MDSKFFINNAEVYPCSLCSKLCSEVCKACDKGLCCIGNDDGLHPIIHVCKSCYADQMIGYMNDHAVSPDQAYVDLMGADKPHPAYQCDQQACWCRVSSWYQDRVVPTT